MTQLNKKRMSTETLVMLSLLTALVALLSYMGGFIKIGGLASISLTLIPVVLVRRFTAPTQVRGLAQYRALYSL